jgi:hypothetical protein
VSYSRWGNSRWYTFWCVAQGDVVENRDNARFEICGEKPDIWFAAAQLREDMDACIRKVAGAVECTPAELEELRGYMRDFLEDVDRRYA